MFTVERLKTAELSAEQVERVIEISGLAFTGAYEKSIRKDLNKDMDIVFVKKNTRIIGFHLIAYTDLMVGDTRICGILGSVLAIERNNAKAIYVLFSSLVNIYFEEQQKCGCRLFALMPIASYHMYRYLQNLYRCYYPNPKYKIPAFEKQVLDTLATHYFGKGYDPASGLITSSNDEYRVRDDIETFTDKELRIQDVAFYKSLNPSQGDHDLACIAEVSRGNMLFRDLKGYCNES